MIKVIVRVEDDVDRSSSFLGLVGLGGMTGVSFDVDDVKAALLTSDSDELVGVLVLW